jgi:hypothetical protein
MYFVSSSPSERWSASQKKGNFTIGNSQSICMFHVSDIVTHVSGVFDTELGFDYLYHQYSGSTLARQGYSGIGSFAEDSVGLTAFQWSSDDDGLSNSFAVEFDSPLSSLPRRLGHGSGDSAEPILVSSDAQNPPRGQRLMRGDMTGSAETAVIIAAAIVFGLVLRGLRDAEADE